MESQQNRHPLPVPPGQQQPTYQSVRTSQNRPTKTRTRSRGFSFRSHNSADKDSHNHHLSLVETHHEKEAKRLHSKADPTMAMNEIEPAFIAAQARHTMGSLRLMEHTDKTGNVITDPDHSNPTRWRLERPLDTIRGFESAIRRNERSSMINTGGDNESVMSGWNPRNSYYASGGRYQHQSYYGGEGQGSRPLSGNFRADSYYDQPQQAHGRWGPPPQDRRRVPRTNPDAQYTPRTAAASQYYGDRSYETVASGSGTSGERAGYTTDPTSENSSVERRQSPPKRQAEPTNDYGIGFSQDPAYQPSSFTVGSQANNQQFGSPTGVPAPTPPRKDGAMLRKPVQEIQAAPEKQKKRKSFFGIGKSS
ncbi:hypothetical protein BD289DRAFT_37973 [Coniella lustricola]|uniref:Uncharacterized protein n=1 Tax=Coniella lustricola TaxID=2025994 RepID=A0A2T3AIQ6_9PEZI|nr:hypothetical protein BD289DRAFT_37973 [Coniella lustricola]